MCLGRKKLGLGWGTYKEGEKGDHALGLPVMLVTIRD